MRSASIFAFVLIFFAGCKKEGPPGPQGPQGAKGETGPQGSIPTGTISGRILQYDAWGAWQNSGLNTTTVSINGTSLSSVTNAEGSYTLTNVPAGTYELLVRKPSSGTGRILQVLFPGNGELFVNGAIADRAPYEFTGGYIRDTLGNSILANLNYPSSTKPRHFIILLSRNAAIDPEDPRSFQISISSAIMINSTAQQNQIPFSNISNLNTMFKSGNVVYFNAYPSSHFAGRYFDAFDKKFVSPGCGAPVGPVQSFIMP